MKNLIILHRVLFRFQNQLIFYNINCTLSSGSILIIKGENGTGKSTLMRCILNLLPVTSGSIFYKKTLLTTKSMALLSHLTHFIHPKYPLRYLHFNVLQNLNYWNLLLNYKTALHYSILLRLLYLHKFINISTRWLSLGQLKRLLLSICLTLSKPIWLLDEPLLGLDFKSIELFQNILQNHRKHGGIVILISHSDFYLVRGISLQL